MKKALYALSCLLLVACTPTSAPVIDRSSVYGVPPNVHVARENENLFLVAMRYNLDYQELGRINRISYPYRLQPGQRVILSSDSATGYPVQESAPKTRNTNKPKPVPKPKETEVVISEPKPAEQPIASDKQKTVAGIKWQWPLKGKVSRTFAAAPEDYKGIDITAKSGASIRAAANGIVVYVGDGLAKYGNLVIISHKDIYLSAYAQLKKIEVDEGQEVRIGEKIATLGSKDFHFEIRKDADTIDPATLLP